MDPKLYAGIGSQAQKLAGQYIPTEAGYLTQAAISISPIQRLQQAVAQLSEAAQLSTLVKTGLCGASPEKTEGVAEGFGHGLFDRISEAASRIEEHTRSIRRDMEDINRRCGDL